MTDQSKPNWKEIDRCGIWKVLGVTECNSCSGLIKCWGTDTQLETNDNAVRKLIDAKNNDNQN